MIEKLLLPHKYKKIGWMILIPTFIVGLTLIIGEFDSFSIKANIFVFSYDSFLSGSKTFEMANIDIGYTLVGILFLIGACMVSFSQEKKEDEFINNLRLSSLMWAVLVNYGLLFFCFIFIYGVSFLYVMVYNIFTVLIIFIIRFNYLLNRSSKMAIDEQ